MIHNPVLRKELLLRFRLRQPTPTRIGIGLLVALGILWFYWQGMVWMLGDASPSTGKEAWTVAVVLQYMIICLVAPSLTANAITQEKEQQTWEMLLFTRLQPAEIVLGKLLARLASVGIILGIFLPFTLFGWARAALGGVASSDYVAPWQFCVAYLLMGVSAFFFATIGLFLSLRLKRTLYAIVTSYVLVIGVLCIGTALFASLLSTLTGDFRLFETSPITWFNPIRLVAALFDPTGWQSKVALLGGLFGYAAMSVLLLTYMIARFRALAYE
ncbi:MAG TPA: ABC transporter permease subunit [Chthonomonadaceae bacterium]|nr:ABC transporter permease subunit [Chthonomonadaceae bacterium]